MIKKQQNKLYFKNSFFLVTLIFAEFCVFPTSKASDDFGLAAGAQCSQLKATDDSEVFIGNAGATPQDIDDLLTATSSYVGTVMTSPPYSVEFMGGTGGNDPLNPTNLDGRHGRPSCPGGSILQWDTTGFGNVYHTCSFAPDPVPGSIGYGGLPPINIGLPLAVASKLSTLGPKIMTTYHQAIRMVGKLPTAASRRFFYYGFKPTLYGVGLVGTIIMLKYDPANQPGCPGLYWYTRKWQCQRFDGSIVKQGVLKINPVYPQMAKTKQEYCTSIQCYMPPDALGHGGQPHPLNWVDEQPEGCFWMTLM